MASERYSLRWRLTLLISVPILLAGVVIGALAVVNSWHEIEEVYDAQLIHSAKVLHRLTGHELREHGEGDIELIPEHRGPEHRYEQNIGFRIWKDGALVTRSENPHVFGDLVAPPGLSDQLVAGEKWRFYVFVEPHSGITVETSERYAIRYELIWHLVLGLLAPAILFLPSVPLLVWYGTSIGLGPLRRLSNDVDRRHSEDMSRIEPDRTPEEVLPLVTALNRLLERLRFTIQREREFTDNAAHELRTPLAAIKTQAQVLMKRGAEAHEYRDSLHNLLMSIERASRMVDQLLAFARLQKSHTCEDEVALSELVRRTARELAPAAVQKNQTLSVECPDSVTLHGNDEALAVLVRNLIDNAIKYTPAGGHIRVEVCNRHRAPLLTVSDTGPGIDSKEKAKVLERFYRPKGSATSGSGLGLAIVKWIADQHRAVLTLDDEHPSGLRCAVHFAGP